MKRRIECSTIFLTLLLCTANASPVNPFLVTGFQGNSSYSALFENLGGGLLQITLSNTGTVAPSDETGVVGALFFNLAGDTVLSPVSMSLGSGSVIVNGSGDPSPDWEYAAGISGPDGATQGLSAAGYGLFGSGNFCSGSGCGNQLKGIDWGLVDSAYVPGSGNSSISGRPMIQDTAVFVLSGISDGFDPSTEISSVSAQYTASLTGTNLPGVDPPSVPEPASYLLFAAGLVLMGTVGKKMRPKA